MKVLWRWIRGFCGVHRKLATFVVAIVCVVVLALLSIALVSKQDVQAFSWKNWRWGEQGPLTDLDTKGEALTGYFGHANDGDVTFHPLLGPYPEYGDMAGDNEAQQYFYVTEAQLAEYGNENNVDVNTAAGKSEAYKYIFLERLGALQNGTAGDHTGNCDDIEHGNYVLPPATPARTSLGNNYVGCAAKQKTVFAYIVCALLSYIPSGYGGASNNPDNYRCVDEEGSENPVDLFTRVLRPYIENPDVVASTGPQQYKYNMGYDSSGTSDIFWYSCEYSTHACDASASALIFKREARTIMAIRLKCSNPIAIGNMGPPERFQPYVTSRITGATSAGHADVSGTITDTITSHIAGDEEWATNDDGDAIEMRFRNRLYKCDESHAASAFSGSAPAGCSATGGVQYLTFTGAGQTGTLTFNTTGPGFYYVVSWIVLSDQNNDGN